MDKFIIHNLFGIEGFNIAWYGVLIATGMVLAVLLSIYRAKKQGYKSDLVIDFALIGIPIAIVTTRLYYVVFNWSTYADDVISVFYIRDGGLAVYGGIIGGMITLFVFCKMNKFPVLKFFDIAIPGLLVGQILGRWGNFTNQEAYGALITNTKLQFFPYGVYIDAVSEWHQATFFYESSINFIILIFLLILTNKVKKDGTLLAIYSICYGIARFVIEGLRTDSLYLTGNIRISQVVSIVFIIGGIVLLLLIQKGKFQGQKYEGKYLISSEENTDIK